MTIPRTARIRPRRVLLGCAALAVAAAGPPPPHGPARPPPHTPPARPQPLPPTPAPSRPEPAPVLDPAIARCRDLTAPFSPTESAPGAGVAEAAGPDGCRFGNLRLRFGRYVGYRMTSLLIRGIPFERTIGPLPHLAIRMEVRGATRFIPDQPPKLAWMLPQQQLPFDVTLDAAYDPAALVLAVDDLSMDGEAAGHVALRAVVANMHLSWQDNTPAPAIESQPELRSLHIELDSRTFLPVYAISLLAGMLPDDDPDGAFRAGRSRAVDVLRNVLPAAGVAADTVDSLAGFTRDFPHPQHPLTLDVAADPPVTADAASKAANDPGQAAALLKTLTVTATYAGPLR